MEWVVVFTALTDMVTVGKFGVRVLEWSRGGETLQKGERESQADRPSLIDRVLFIRVGEGPCRGVIGCCPQERGGCVWGGMGWGLVQGGGNVREENCLMQDIY